MTRLRHWLIRRLGGHVYTLEERKQRMVNHYNQYEGTICLKDGWSTFSANTGPVMGYSSASTLSAVCRCPRCRKETPPA